MKLSIISINYNNKSGLQRTAESVIKQSCQDFEWIVIDGLSTDGSAELLKFYSRYISYGVSEADNGIYHAMNKGIKMAHGEYLTFLNSGDTLYNKYTIENVMPLLDGKDIYVGKINSIGRNNECDEEQSDFSPEGILRKLTFTWVPHQASFFKKSVFNVYGLYREDLKIVSDWWAYYCFLVLGKATVGSVPSIIANYDTTGVSATHRAVAVREQKQLLSEYPCIHLYYKFYQENLEIVSALKDNKLFFFLFRIYFYFYRRFTHK